MGWKINIIVGILGAIGSVHVLLAPPWKSIALSVLLVMLAWGTATAWQENEKLRRNRSPEEIAADERDKQRRQDALFKFLKEHEGVVFGIFIAVFTMLFADIYFIDRIIA